MEQIPEQPPKPEGPPSVDVEQKAKDYIQSLKDRPKPAPVDYTKLRPIKKVEESPEVVKDKELRLKAIEMAKASGGTRTTQAILDELRQQERAQKTG